MGLKILLVISSQEMQDGKHAEGEFLEEGEWEVKIVWVGGEMFGWHRPLDS